MESREKAQYPVIIWPAPREPMPEMVARQWPGVPVPMVPVLVNTCVELADHRTLVFGSDDRSGMDYRKVDIPPELYLRGFMHLDTTDPAAVLDFCREYGEVGSSDWSDLPLDVHSAAADLQPPGQAELAKGVHGHQSCELVDSVRTVAEVELYQQVLADAVLLWRFLQGQVTRDEVAESLTWLVRAVRGSEWPLRDALGDLIWTVNAALQPFHARLTGPYQLGVPTPNVYQCMCLQLANHIAENAVYSECAAEDCQHLFVRTQGYSRYGQNRLRGNKYCSTRCANRQHQRELRRRRAAAKRQAGGAVPPDTSTEGSTP